MKGALHFVTKLIFRDTQKCSCFWVASYDVFASARKTGSRANGDRRSQIDKQISSTVLFKPKLAHLPSPPKKQKQKQNSRIPGSAPIEKSCFFVFGYTFVLQQSGEYSRMVNNDR